ncbi:MAG: hypothetical protein QGG54_22250, partial [Gammaproteobacteria bacterium]|nr:hypothetical protein [Gammaproteobacteria bacterium]
PNTRWAGFFAKDADPGGKNPSGMGWFDFQRTGAHQITIVDWAFETDIQNNNLHLFDRGEPKNGEPIPEPGTLATLALTRRSGTLCLAQTPTETG